MGCFTVDSMVCGYLDYGDIWSASLSEISQNLQNFFPTKPLQYTVGLGILAWGFVLRHIKERCGNVCSYASVVQTDVFNFLQADLCELWHISTTQTQSGIQVLVCGSRADENCSLLAKLWSKPSVCLCESKRSLSCLWSCLVTLGGRVGHIYIYYYLIWPGLLLISSEVLLEAN